MRALKGLPGNRKCTSSRNRHYTLDTIATLIILTCIFTHSLYAYPSKIDIIIIRKNRSVNQVYPGCTTGKLYVNGHYFCATLERLFDDSEGIISAVPVGKYKAFLRYSGSKRQWRIQLESTIMYTYDEYDPFILTGRKKRTGIQIHHGTRPAHTRGCILVGVNGPGPCRLQYSKSTFNRLLRTYFGSSTNPRRDRKITVTIRTDYN